MQQADAAPITGASATISGISADRTGCHRVIDIENTRRGLLAGLALLPMLSVVPAMATVPDGGWSRAVAAYRVADRAMNEYDRDYLTPVSNKWMAWRAGYSHAFDFERDPVAQAELDAMEALYDPVQEHFDLLCDRQRDAGDRMVATPAPDLMAVIAKIELLIDEAAGNTGRLDDAMPHLLSDLRRLGGVA